MRLDDTACFSTGQKLYLGLSIGLSVCSGLWQGREVDDLLNSAWGELLCTVEIWVLEARTHLDMGLLGHQVVQAETDIRILWGSTERHDESRILL